MFTFFVGSDCNEASEQARLSLGNSQRHDAFLHFFYDVRSYRLAITMSVLYDSINTKMSRRNDSHDELSTYHSKPLSTRSNLVGM